MPRINETVSKKYFYIGEVAAMTGVSTSAIRFYEDQLFIEVKKRNSKGERLFNDKEVKIFKWVVKASVVYKLQVIRIALMTFPPPRFLKDELLNHDELTQILNHETIRAIGRSHPDQARPTR